MEDTTKTKETKGQKTEEQKTEDQKTEDQKTEDQKTEERETEDEKKKLELLHRLYFDYSSPAGLSNKDKLKREALKTLKSITDNDVLQFLQRQKINRQP